MSSSHWAQRRESSGRVFLVLVCVVVDDLIFFVVIGSSFWRTAASFEFNAAAAADVAAGL